MAGEDDEIVVTIEDDLESTLGAEVLEVAKKATPDEPIADLKQQFTALQGQLANANQRAAQIETDAQRLARERDEIAARAKELETEVVETRKGSVDQGLQAAKDEADSAQAEYERAFADGDGPAAARAQRKMAQAEAKIFRLSEAKDDLAATKPAPRKTEPEPQRRPAPSDAVEAFIQGAKMSPKSADFIRRNPLCATDPKTNARMLAAHNLALADDVEVESEEYFRRIEEGIKPKTEQKPARQVRPGALAAPGADAGGRTPSGGSVTLTRGEAAAATDGTLVWNYDDPSGKNKFKKGDPIGVQEMARRKLAGMREGRYDRSFVES